MTQRRWIFPTLPALATVLCLVAVVGTAVAQTKFNDNSLPITVEADDGIEWIANTKMYVARGNARATRGTLSVAAETLTAVYRDTETDDAEIYRLEAVGRVVVTSPGRTAYGDRAVYDLDQAVVVLLGENLKLVTDAETITASESLEYWEDRQIAVARGDAVATQKGRRIRADALTVHFVKGPDSTLEARRMDAVGNVRITTPQEVARGGEGVYTVNTGIVTLTGNVKITRGDTQLNGAVAEVNLNTGISRLLSSKTSAGSGRVRGLFVPKSKTRKKN